MTATQIRQLAELSRRAALLATGQPSPVAHVFMAEHARIVRKLQSASLR